MGSTGSTWQGQRPWDGQRPPQLNMEMDEFWVVLLRLREISDSV